MEVELPMLTCVLQHTLRSLCTSSDSSNSSKWVYAVFWRILPRNYPPPKWDHGLLDRAKGNKRNWILVWEDGFCDFCECETAGSGYVKGRFGADIFFKMSHEVYNFGEGLVGKIAADNSHKWVFKDTPTESDPTFMSSWNVSIDPQQPRAWEAQFNSGIETIAIISVQEGAIQLGSFDKVVEDLNLALSIQRKFSYLQSIPGMYSMQRPYLSSIQNPINFDCNMSLVPMATNGISCGIEGNHRKIIGLKRQNYDSTTDDSPTSKSIFLGYNSPHSGVNGSLPVWSVPPLLPSTPCNLGAFLSKIPTVPRSYYAHIESIHDHESTFVDNNLKNGRSQDLKVDECGGVPLDEIPITNIKVKDASCAREASQEEKPRSPSRFESSRRTCLRVAKNLN